MENVNRESCLGGRRHWESIEKPRASGNSGCFLFFPFQFQIRNSKKKEEKNDHLLIVRSFSGIKSENPIESVSDLNSISVPHRTYCSQWFKITVISIFFLLSFTSIDSIRSGWRSMFFFTHRNELKSHYHCPMNFT